MKMLSFHPRYLARFLPPAAVEEIKQVGSIDGPAMRVDVHDARFRQIWDARRKLQSIPEGYEPTPANAVSGGCGC